VRIFVVSKYGYWGDFDPRAAYSPVEGNHAQIGGGETAMINIAHELAKLGHEVFVFYQGVSGRYDGVDYVRGFYSTPIMNEIWHDALIAWDAMDAFRFYSRSRVRVGAFQLNDAGIGVLDHMVDIYMCPSKWHAERFQQLYPEMTASKFRPTTTNGVSPDLYALTDGGWPTRQPYKVIYSSSPDRGLHHLLGVWEEVKRAIPQAELHVYYDISRWFALVEQILAAGLPVNTEDRYHEVKRLLGELNHAGMGPILHGGVSKSELAKAQLSAHVMCYPCDPVQPTEGFSMSCLEGLQAGTYLLATDADALGELWTEFERADELQITQGGLAGPARLLPWPPKPEALAAALVDTLRRDPQPNGPSQDPRLEKYHWAALAKQWEEELRKCLQT
jgi:glycosyltransferase involved in cell wall biosynthesis